MEIDQKTKDLENIYKKVLFEEIRDISKYQSELILKTEGLKKHTGINIDLPNIGITCNNKLIELQHEFEKAGLSMYSIRRGNNVSSANLSFVANAIVSDLLEYVKRGSQNSKDYRNTLYEIMNKKVKELKKIQQNPIRRFFDQMRMLLTEQNNICTTEEIKTIEATIFRCKDTDSQLWDYNLRDHIVPSIVKKIRKQKYKAFMVPKLLVDDVNPDLSRLGLADLIPQLQSTLIEEYRKDLSDPAICQVSQESMFLYVPDFSRKIESEEEMLNAIQTTIDEGKEGAKAYKMKITLEDFKSIDDKVGALDRQEIVTNIAKGQGKGRKVEKNTGEDPVLKEEDILL